MKNHWTDKTLVKDFINKISIRIAKLTNTDVDFIRKIIEEDVRRHPLADEDLDMIRQADDVYVNKVTSMLPPDLLAKLFDLAKHLDDSDGLW